MAVIADDAHAVNPSTVCVATKAEAVQEPPNPSSYYVAVQASGGSGQVLRWDDEGPRDEFYKRLIEAMEKG